MSMDGPEHETFAAQPLQEIEVELHKASVDDLQQTGAETLGQIAINGLVSPKLNSDIFADLPDRHSSLQAKNKDKKTVYAMHEIAKKLYQCMCCSNLIEIGSEHTVMRTIQVDKKYQHNHVHSSCFSGELINKLSDVSVVDSHVTERKNLNLRRQKYMRRRSYRGY